MLWPRRMNKWNIFHIYDPSILGTAPMFFHHITRFRHLFAIVLQHNVLDYTRPMNDYEIDFTQYVLTHLSLDQVCGNTTKKSIQWCYKTSQLSSGSTVIWKDLLTLATLKTSNLYITGTLWGDPPITSRILSVIDASNNEESVYVMASLSI